MYNCFRSFLKTDRFLSIVRESTKYKFREWGFVATCRDLGRSFFPRSLATVFWYRRRLSVAIFSDFVDMPPCLQAMTPVGVRLNADATIKPLRLRFMMIGIGIARLSEFGNFHQFVYLTKRGQKRNFQSSSYHFKGWQLAKIIWYWYILPSIEVGVIIAEPSARIPPEYLQQNWIPRALFGSLRQVVENHFQ